MTTGGILFGLVGPILVMLVGNLGSNSMIAFESQSLLGLSLASWGAPMCAWLVESFEPEARLTSVSIGYNVAQAANWRRHLALPCNASRGTGWHIITRDTFDIVGRHIIVWTVGCCPSKP
jgi:hypothetical protein